MRADSSAAVKVDRRRAAVVGNGRMVLGARRARAVVQDLSVIVEQAQMQRGVNAELGDIRVSAPTSRAATIFAILAAASVVAKIDVERRVEAQVVDSRVLAPVVAAVAVHVRSLATMAKIDDKASAGVNADVVNVWVVLPVTRAAFLVIASFVWARDAEFGRDIKGDGQAESKERMAVVIDRAIAFDVWCDSLLTRLTVAG